MGIVEFFQVYDPVSLDIVMIPWLQKFVAGNLITIYMCKKLAEYIAKVTPWAKDDEILQIFTGAIREVVDAFRGARKQD